MYTLPLHDALPIWSVSRPLGSVRREHRAAVAAVAVARRRAEDRDGRDADDCDERNEQRVLDQAVAEITQAAGPDLVGALGCLHFGPYLSCARWCRDGEGRAVARPSHIVCRGSTS